MTVLHQNHHTIIIDVHTTTGKTQVNNAQRKCKGMMLPME